MKTLALAFLLAASVAGGKWQRVEVRDDLTGGQSIVYVLHASTATPNGLSRDPTIRIVCTGNKPQMFYMADTVVRQNTTSMYSNQPQTFVSWRADDSGDVKVSTWNIGADLHTLSMDKKAASAVVGHSKFVVRFPSATGSEMTDVFETEGLDVGFCGKR